MRTTLLILSLCAPAAAQAAGFALIEQSGTGMGNAYAGMAARSDDASTQYYNPANLAFLPAGAQLSAGASVIVPQIELHGGAASSPTFGGAPVAGNDGGNAGMAALVPNFHYANQWSERLSYGVSVTVPFGLGTEYDDGWLGRYHALESQLKTLNVNPAVAWKATPRLALGAGVSVQYADARLTSQIDSSGICLGTAPLATCSALGLNQLGNAAADSHSRLEGDDVSFGFNAGAVYRPSDATALGLAYRSHIRHNITGEATFVRSAGLDTLLSGAGSALLTDTDLEAKLSLPETVALSAVHQASERLELLADVTWTNWSRFKELRIQFDNPVQPDAVTTTHWNDSWRFSLGANYRYSPTLKLKVGVAYDQTPVPSAQRRTPRIPDADRTWLALGASWQMSPRHTLDIGYAHLFMHDAKIDNTTEGLIAYNLRGTLEPRVDMLSVQYVHAF